MALDTAKVSVLLYGLEKLLRLTARRHPSFAARLKEKDLVAHVRLRDGTQGRTFTFEGGVVRSRAGIHGDPQVVLSFETAAIAARLLDPRRSQLDFVSAAKTFQMEALGDDENVVWLSQTLNMLASIGTDRPELDQEPGSVKEGMVWGAMSDFFEEDRSTEFGVWGSGFEVSRT